MAPVPCAVIYNTALGTEHNPAKTVDRVIVGLEQLVSHWSLHLFYVSTNFRCPPDMGAAEKMKRLSPMKLASAAYNVFANGDLSDSDKADEAPPRANVRRHVPIEESED